jgi:hypothetical protein
VGMAGHQLVQQRIGHSAFSRPSPTAIAHCRRFGGLSMLGRAGVRAIWDLMQGPSRRRQRSAMDQNHRMKGWAAREVDTPP